MGGDTPNARQWIFGEPRSTRVARHPRSAGTAVQAAEVARSVELDERLAATAGADLASGDERVPGDRPTVRGVAGEFSLVEDAARFG